jgi:Uncharacterised nucleotidyltransferase
MELYTSIRQLIKRLDEGGLRYAVIGGIAMAMRGVQRATFDLDFLLMLEDMASAREILLQEGYACVYQSENVSHFQKTGGALARVDVLHAFRGPSLSMLQRAEKLPLGDSCLVPVLQIEDLIGLKVQAATNDPMRALGDWSDIYRLVIQAADSTKAMNWPLIEDYLVLFRCAPKLSELKDLYERHYRPGKTANP